RYREVPVEAPGHQRRPDTDDSLQDRQDPQSNSYGLRGRRRLRSGFEATHSCGTTPAAAALRRRKRELIMELATRKPKSRLVIWKRLVAWNWCADRRDSNTALRPRAAMRAATRSASALRLPDPSNSESSRASSIAVLAPWPWNGLMGCAASPINQKLP